MNLIIAGVALIVLGLLGLIIIPALKFLFIVLISGTFVLGAISLWVAGYWPLALLAIGLLLTVRNKRTITT